MIWPRDVIGSDIVGLPWLTQFLTVSWRSGTVSVKWRSGAVGVQGSEPSV